MADKNDLWKAATRNNVRTIRGIFRQQGNGVDTQARNSLYRMALDIVLTELKPSEPFPWGKFQNVLRILVCGASATYDEATMFDIE